MFDLKQQINKWRAQLAISEAYQDSDLEELEGHLMDEIDNFRKNNKLGEEEAFVIARHRIGDAAVLTDEFRKVNTNIIWKNRLTWVLGGYCFFTLANIVISALSQTFTILGAAHGLAPNILFQLDLLLKVLILGSFITVIFSNSARISLKS